jgi:hypothetical protein
VTHLGYHETPVNQTPFGKHYSLDGEPWCALFVSYCFEKSGHPLPVMQAGMKNGYAAVIYAMQYAEKHGCWRPSWEAEAGDIIVYGWDGAKSSPDEMHTGFIVSSGPSGSTGHTIEGNRGDQVEKQTFVVGADVVLGTVDVKKLLGLPAKPTLDEPTVQPKPQPRSVKHPTNSGPTPLDVDTQAMVEALSDHLKRRTSTVAPGGGVRKEMRALITLLHEALGDDPPPT